MYRAWIATSLMLAAQAAGAGRIVCWTDENGQRACGDRVPPQYAKTERQVLDENARVVEVKAREKTPEELAEQARQEREAAQARARAEEQARYDSYLLQAYQSVDDIVVTRDSRVRVLNGRLGLSEKAIGDGERALAELRGRAESLSRGDKPVPAKLAQQIRDYEASLQRQRASAAQLRAERASIVEQFARDIARYRELRGLPDAAIPPPPGGGTAADG